MKTSTLRNLAKRALNYLASLQQPLPDESDAKFYEENAKDYRALLKLNKAGFGSTEEELQALVDAPLSDDEIVKIVKRIEVLDKKMQDEYAKEEKIENNPSMWNGFFSGYQVTATARCSQIMKGIRNRINKYSDEQSDLFLSITRQQCMDAGYPTCGMCDEDFKQA